MKSDDRLIVALDFPTMEQAGACVEECPTEAITAGDSAYVIDADKCIDCGACAGACPVGAPVEG